MTARPTSLLAAAALAAAALPDLAAAAERTAAVERAMASVVSVLPDRPGSATGGHPPEPEGSGVVVGDGRSVLTALHVLGAATKVRVRTADGRVIEARIGGRDPATDLALIGLDEPLPAIELGPEPQLADEVCAIGNAFGLGLSVSCGTVSAVGRAGTGFNPIEDFIQTDAAVNPGASGGALIDGEGRLVGILSAIYTKQSDANIGVNFAVSALIAGKSRDMMALDRPVRWPALGISGRSHPGPGGVGLMAIRVTALEPGGAGEAAGLQAGDLIIAADGHRVTSPAELRRITARAGHGAAISLAIDRSGAQITLTLTLPDQ